MFLFPDLAKTILKALIDAENRGAPLMPKDCASWYRGSTWDDLWENGYIDQNPDLSVLASQSGKHWYEANKKDQRNNSPR